MGHNALTAPQHHTTPSDLLSEWHSRRAEREREWKHAMNSFRGASPEHQLQQYHSFKQHWYSQLRQKLLQRQAAQDAKRFMKQLMKDDREKKQLEGYVLPIPWLQRRQHWRQLKQQVKHSKSMSKAINDVYHNRNTRRPHAPHWGARHQQDLCRQPLTFEAPPKQPLLRAGGLFSACFGAISKRSAAPEAPDGNQHSTSTSSSSSFTLVCPCNSRCEVVATKHCRSRAPQPPRQDQPRPGVSAACVPAARETTLCLADRLNMHSKGRCGKGTLQESSASRAPQSSSPRPRAVTTTPCSSRTALMLAGRQASGSAVNCVGNGPMLHAFSAHALTPSSSKA